MNIFKKYKIRVSKNYKLNQKYHLYFYFRKIFFSIFGIIFFPFFTFTNKKPSPKIIILGRGQSTNFFFANFKKFKEIKSIFLVNFCTSDFPKNYSTIFKKKIIFFFTNITEVIPSVRILSKLQIGKVFFGRCKSMEKFDYGKRKSFKCNILYSKFSYLPDTLLNYWWLNNNGLISICYAANLINVKNIYLFGFNFYFDNYISKTIKDEVKKTNKYHAKQLINARYKLRNNFIKLVKAFPKIKFHLHIERNLFKKKPKNLNIVLIK